MELPTKRHLFTVEHYQELVNSGVLTEHDRVDHIKGKIVDMPPIRSKHAAIVSKLTFQFGQIINPKMQILSVQDPVQLPNDSQPVPDLALLHAHFSGLHNLV